MKNKVEISKSLGNEERKEEVRGLLKRLPADITMEDGSLPGITLEFESASEDAYSLRVPEGYKVRSYDRNCVLVHMDIVDLTKDEKWVHVKDYIDFGDAQHPRKISHKFYINPEVNNIPPRYS